MPDSLWRDAARSFCNTFFKFIGGIIAIVVILVGLSTLSSGGPLRTTNTVVLPNHTWRAKPYSSMTPTILRIPIVGTIGLNPYVNKEQLANVLTEFQLLDLSPDVFKAVLLYINSPGGTSDDADGMLRILMEFKKRSQVPVYAYVDGLCASGGVLVSLSADKIIASSPSIVGSVGVLLPTTFNVSKTMTSLGIDALTLHAGKNKDELNPFRPWGPDEGASMQRLIDSYYDRFIKLVSVHRPRLTEEELREMGAQVYPAQEALRLGFIDQVNDSYLDTLEEIASSLDIANNYQVIELQPQFSLSELFAPNPSAIFKGQMHHYVRVPGDVSPELANKVLYLYHPGGDSR